jgi:hypothetical protein
MIVHPNIELPSLPSRASSIPFLLAAPPPMGSYLSSGHATCCSSSSITSSRLLRSFATAAAAFTGMPLPCCVAMYDPIGLFCFYFVIVFYDILPCLLILGTDPSCCCMQKSSFPQELWKAMLLTNDMRNKRQSASNLIPSSTPCFPVTSKMLLGASLTNLLYVCAHVPPRIMRAHARA